MLLREFQLTFRVGGKPGNEETEHIAAWMECGRKSRDFEICTLRRRVQRHRPGQAEPKASEPITLAEPYNRSDGSSRLKEFLYLWTRDHPADAHVQPQLQENLKQLRCREDQEHERDALASATVYMYDHAPGEVLRYMGVVSTKAALRQVILELPTDCTTFEIHLKAAGRIIGNAEYRVDHDIDQMTGKRKSAFSAEYGSCENMIDIFADLYSKVDLTVDELLRNEKGS